MAALNLHQNYTKTGAWLIGKVSYRKQITMYNMYLKMLQTNIVSTNILFIRLLHKHAIPTISVSPGRLNTTFQNYPYPFQNNIYKQFAKWNHQFDSKHIIIHTNNHSSVKCMQDNVYLF